MESHRSDGGADRALPWLLLAGVGLAGAAWWVTRRGGRHDTAPGLRAPLAPINLARQEAKWTREALRSK